MPDESCRKCGGGLIEYARRVERIKFLLKMRKKYGNVVPHDGHADCFKFFDFSRFSMAV
jgi:hypothetical protein